jgi:hypothetical protein
MTVGAASPRPLIAESATPPGPACRTPLLGNVGQLSLQLGLTVPTGAIVTGQAAVAATPRLV